MGKLALAAKITHVPSMYLSELPGPRHGSRQDAHEWVEVGRGAWDPQQRVSYADADRLLRVDPSAVRREGASLDERAFERVVDRVAQLHGWTR